MKLDLIKEFISSQVDLVWTSRTPPNSGRDFIYGYSGCTLYATPGRPEPGHYSTKEILVYDEGASLIELVTWNGGGTVTLIVDLNAPNSLDQVREFLCQMF